MKYTLRYSFLVFYLLMNGFSLLAQEKLVLSKDTLSLKPSKLVADTVNEIDVSDVFNMLFRRNRPKVKHDKKSGSLSLLPSIGYTPSTGFEFGADISGSRYFGDPDHTTLSIFDAYGAISTNELAFIQLNHNVHTNGNKWNLKGSWELGKTLVLDHGLGTGREQPQEFPITYTYLKLSETIYRKIYDNFYAGAGLSFNYYTNIDDELLTAERPKTHNYIYSLKNGFPPDNYFVSGLLVNLQYDSRDQPYRPYKGLYVDLVLRSNRTWLGSEKDAIQLRTEVRKYWSLSAKNPEHVLAFWLWGSYLLKGSLPYLDLPGTGSDTEQRIGRGYTIGRFKGPSYYYNELEYRFPITANKLISGVGFFNVQTAGDERNIKLFSYWEPGGGAGLRILFNKHTRSNLCIDYGIGNYGSNGIFVGLNEVF